MQSQLTQFNSFYRNINNGDRYTLIYIPQIGIQLYLNNNILLGTIDFDNNNMTITEQYDLARIVYSVWFGPIAPFSTTMRDELLVPLSRPTITTTILQSFQRNAMNATSFNMNTNNNHGQYHHQHCQDDIGGSLQRALLGIANDTYYDTMLRMTTIAMILLVILSLWKKMMTMTTNTNTSSSKVVLRHYSTNKYDKTK
jgi:hypothetical protein